MVLLRALRQSYYITLTLFCQLKIINTIDKLNIAVYNNCEGATDTVDSLEMVKNNRLCGSQAVIFFCIICAS